MKEKKSFVNFIFFIGAVLLYLAVILYIAYGYICRMDGVYGDTYYAALKIKYDRIASVDKPKIVVIGGSSVAFGIDSKLVEQETGMPCVNFGLYAAIGMKPMLDFSKPFIKNGDIVVVAPELSSQMYSGYTGYEYLMDSMEERPDMAFSLGKEYARGFIAILPEYLAKRAKIKKNGLELSGIYRKSSFDEYGDIIYPREENVMAEGYLDTDMPDISGDILTDEFFGMINGYTEYCLSKGAEVYFGFPPVNGLSAGWSADDIKSFNEKLSERLDCTVLSSLEDHILDAGYFYDSNFHTNDPGTICNTILLINDIKRVKNDMTKVSATIPEPLEIFATEPSDIKSDETYIYSLSEKGILIKGLTDSGKEVKELVIPDQIDGYRVYGIGSGAFDGSKAVTLTIPQSVSYISAGILKDAGDISSITILAGSLPEVSLEMLSGAPENIEIFVRKELYGKYITDYFWGVFSDKIKALETE
jgi:hypothetical protein